MAENSSFLPSLRLPSCGQQAGLVLPLIAKAIRFRAFLDKKESTVIEMTHEEWLNGLN